MNILDLKRKLLPLSGPQGDSGGGGGGGGSATQTQTQITELPEWARPYAKNTLEKTAALTETPYQTYGGPRIAGFSPLQQQAQEQAANMQTSGLTGLGGQVAGAAALGGLGQQYQAGQFSGGQFSPYAAGAYMSPFIQQAMAPQLREAQRASEIMAQQNAARAVGQGAFGGSRAGLVEAERQRNLGTQLGDIQSRGYQTAYEQAQNQFNQDMTRRMQAQQLGEQSRQFGANLGLQGLNTALQGAGQLGALGGQQFQQGMDINKLQSAYGGQQQALRQQGLDQAYQDFLNQQNYPYKQLGFMADMIRGLPLGQQNTRAMYEAPPSTMQQLGAAGLGAYGLSKFMAEGGMAYADGGEVGEYADGGSVDAPDNVQRIVSKLSDQQLQQAAQAAQVRGDMDQLEAIRSEMAMRASERRGIAAGITPQMADRMAGGGIVAFSGDEETNDPVGGQMVVSPGNKKAYDLAAQRYLESDEALAKFKPREAMTLEERDALDKANFERYRKFAGEDPYAPMVERLKGYDADRLKSLERGKGLAALQAIPAILRPGNTVRAFGEAAGQLGSGLSALDKADAAEKRALGSMQFNLADAQRKERMGLTRDAIQATAEAQKDQIAADKARLEAIKARGANAASAARAFRPVGTSGAGGAGKLPQVDRLAGQIATQIVDLRQKNPKDPQIPALEAKLEALKEVIATTKISDKGPAVLAMEAQKLAAMTDKDIDEQVRKSKFLNADWQEAMGDARKQAEVERRIRNELMTRRNEAASTVNKNSSTVTPIKLD